MWTSSGTRLLWRRGCRWDRKLCCWKSPLLSQKKKRKKERKKRKRLPACRRSHLGPEDVDVTVFFLGRCLQYLNGDVLIQSASHRFFPGGKNVTDTAGKSTALGSSSPHCMCCFGVVCHFCCCRHFLSASRASSPSGSGSSLLQRHDLAAKQNRANAAMRIDSPRGSGWRCHGARGARGVGAGLHAKRQRGRSEPACVHLIYLGSEERKRG